MSARDMLRLATGAIVAHQLRSALTVLGIVIGIASVILLTSLGEGARRYILAEFTQFGTNLLQITPGRVETTGIPGAIGATIRKLTLEDAEALKRIVGVQEVVPVSFGMARVEAGARGRSVFVYGVTEAVPRVWKFEVGQGRFLPAGDLRRAAPFAALGPKLKREIFGDDNALGRHIRIGGRRFQVIGVMAPKGLLLGVDIDDAAYVPVASAQRLFNRDEVMEIDVLFAPGMPSQRIVADLRDLLTRRHGGEEDFTITTQAEMLDVLGNVIGIVSAAVAGIGAISLLVGGIGILTIMWIAVGERTSEIGLAQAVGASRGQILALFLLEAGLLSLAGGVLGLSTGLGLARVIGVVVPGLPLHTPPQYAVAALLVSVAVGLVSGALPARRAARLEPVDALHAE